MRAGIRRSAQWRFLDELCSTTSAQRVWRRRLGKVHSNGVVLAWNRRRPATPTLHRVFLRRDSLASCWDLLSMLVRASVWKAGEKHFVGVTCSSLSRSTPCLTVLNSINKRSCQKRGKSVCCLIVKSFSVNVQIRGGHVSSQTAAMWETKPP